MFFFSGDAAVLSYEVVRGVGSLPEEASNQGAASHREAATPPGGGEDSPQEMASHPCEEAQARAAAWGVEGWKAGAG